MRVCYFGTYRANYSRNQIMIAGLRCNGVEVVECHATLWSGIEDRVQVASGGWMHPGFWLRVLRTYARLLKRYRQVGPYDILIVGYPGQYDVFLARLLSWLRRKPLVWDVLNSMYLISVERGIAERHSFTAKLVRGLEGIACRMPDRLILDAAEFVRWFQQTHKLSAERFRLVPIGADDQVFREVKQSGEAGDPQADGVFRVLYYGTYIPNHGVETIVEAARLLEPETGIQIEFVGEGPEREKALALAKRYGLKNVVFTGWMEKTDLAIKIAHADVCLGIFGTSLQASLTNNNKIYEAFALSRPVITGQTPSMPSVLKHGENLYLVERGNPRALAQGILDLRGDPDLRRRLGEQGYHTLYENFDIAHIGQAFAAHLYELVGSQENGAA